jgi:hypothetical protein
VGLAVPKGSTIICGSFRGLHIALLSVPQLSRARATPQQHVTAPEQNCTLRDIFVTAISIQTI